MSFEVPPVNGAVPGVQPVTRTDKPQSAGDAGGVEEVRLDTIPSSPPVELHDEIDRAAKRVDELRADGRELHFAYDKDAGRVQIQVRDLDGNVVRTIPPSKALSVISGQKLD
jgi:flagellar protein FlaG